MDDFIDSEVAVVAAALATLLSPRVRSVVRRGAVYGLAGVLAVADAFVGTSRDMRRGVQRRSGPGIEDIVNPRPANDAGKREGAE